MVQLAAVVVIECKSFIIRTLEIIATNSSARVTLSIDWCKCSTAILQDPDSSCSRSIQCNIVQLTAMVEIYRKSSIIRTPQIIAAYAIARITLLINRRKYSACVLQDPDCPCIWSIQYIERVSVWDTF